jgi:hypothetical protein
VPLATEAVAAATVTPAPCVGNVGLGIRENRAYVCPAMKKPRDVIHPRWGVYMLKRKAERFPFTVAGRNPQEAIERAIKEYEVPEREDFRISVQREA